ncbi:carboxylate--amine ligase [Halobacillus sp. BBL2006]|uniref:carboxylate--amine ligase n=1 Tax=Halobacillus sp. BBL2006 TaxID=1543706 RepID=UPI000542C84F|nr:carboxylate--amine ligase [Halobacillus sp. BBL2006]KHE71595.1 carboxylate--amine ligase [Halobacillus sp. BBL2006]
MNNKAVVLGANYYIGLSTIRCLGVHGVHVAAVDYSWTGAYGLESKYVTEALIGPHYKEDPKGLLSFLIDYAKKESVPPVLIPTADPYVEFVDEHLHELREYFLIPQTEQGLYTKIMDKGTLHALASEHGVAVPETVNADDENFVQKVEETIQYPCLVKPVDSPAFVSKFRRKLFKVYNKEELLEKVHLAKEADIEVIIQRVIPGFDDHMYTFDAYLNQEAKVTHWVTCQKLRQFPINFGASVYTQQKHVPELYDLGAKFLEGIGYKGFAEIEFKKDAETGRFYLIEINVRITNLNSLLDKTGINIPYIMYRELIENPVDPKAIEEDKNLVFWYAYEDLLAVREYVKTGQLSVKNVLASYFRPKAHAIWDAKDPKPAIAFGKKMAGLVAGKVLKKG